ncbi:MAG: hypothetical protein EOP43_08230, partial [Sphingobacteriaceae bacterium]
MKKKLLSFLLVLFFIGSYTYAQNRKVTGTIIAREDGLSIPGVSVRVPGTTIGTQTDASGKFTLNVPPTAKTLEISFLGYSTTTATIGANG